MPSWNLAEQQNQALEKGLTSMGRDNAKSYIVKKGELMGMVKLVMGCHTIRHNVCFYFTKNSISDSFLQA
jgi:hypothetical protein